MAYITAAICIDSCCCRTALGCGWVVLKSTAGAIISHRSRDMGLLSGCTVFIQAFSILIKQWCMEAECWRKPAEIIVLLVFPVLTTLWPTWRSCLIERWPPPVTRAVQLNEAVVSITALCCFITAGLEKKTVIINNVYVKLMIFFGLKLAKW